MLPTSLPEMTKELGGGARRGLFGLENLRKTLEEMSCFAARGAPPGSHKYNRKLQSCTEYLDKCDLELR